MEKTLCVIKPDGVERQLIGEIISRIERKGLQISGLKLFSVSREQAAEHYKEHLDKPFYKKLVEYITSGPVVAMCVEGHRAISVLRTIVGKTDPVEALPGTIRGDFGLCKGRNLVHASDSQAAAERELKLYFSKAEIITHSPTILPWVYRED